MSHEKSRLVYSTGSVISRREDNFSQASHLTVLPSRQRIIIRLERKGRGGKSVTLIEGLQITREDMTSLMRQLKTELGTGGAMKGDILEIQGDHRDSIISMLQRMGYNPKRSGG